MTREEFLNLDWDDSHIGYDMQINDSKERSFRTIAYITMSEKYPGTLCLVAGSKDFPVRNTGCGLSNNPAPFDVIELLRRHKLLKKVIAVKDDKAYDLTPGIMHVNAMDMEVLFEITPIEP